MSYDNAQHISTVTKSMYGLIGTARLSGIDAEAWLRQVLTHIADRPVNRINDFLPWNCAAKLAG